MQPNPVHTSLQEADDLLAEIEQSALAMAQAAAGDEIVNQIFRAFHTIKGSGAMFGFDGVATFTHHVETLLDQVREGVVPVSQQLSNVILAAADHIKLLLLASQGGDAVDVLVEAALLEEVRQLSTATPAVPTPTASSIAAVPEDSGNEPKLWHILFRPHPALLQNGGNPVLLLRDLRQLGSCVIEGHSDRLPPLEEMQTDVCYLWWTADLRTTASLSEIRDVFLFVEHGSELEITPAQDVPPAKSEAAAIQPEPANRPSSQTPVSSAAAPVAQACAKESTVRVPSNKLDRLVNLVGELVMNQSRLASVASRFHAPELAAPVEEIERLVAELRDDVLEIRMTPIGTIFGRFRRLVHDLSKQLGKDIELITEGEETELDKSILDQLGEPLVHLVRNSIDHGIESGADRAAKGKPPKGTIRLTASHRGSDVVVRIEDDGAGLDRAAIRAKAVARQLIAPDASLSDKEIFNLILLPGFSTAQAVTSISGRGVGMDVVKRQIDALRGSISITSETGRGLCVALTLPLTLAIIEGLLVEVGDNQFIIPMAVVTENVELSSSERSRNNGRNIVAVRGELLPYVDLRQAFHVEGSGPAVSKIVLVRHEDQRVGLVVDRVMGTHQTVIQALGKFFREIKVVSGSTVMGDGRVALILDVPGIVRLAGSETNGASRPPADLTEVAA